MRARRPYRRTVTAHTTHSSGRNAPAAVVVSVLGAYLVLYPRSRIQSLVFLGFFYQLLAVPAAARLARAWPTWAATRATAPGPCRRARWFRGR